jgi:uncharacterized membrane protein YgaE (UPF0421/DUF939 family)
VATTAQSNSTSWRAGLLHRARTGAWQGFRTGVVAAFCYWLTRKFGLREGYWAAISAIVVMQSELGATVDASRDRLIGTAIGGVLGWASASLWNGNVLIYAAGIFLSMFVCWALNLGTAGRLSGVTVSIITLVAHTTSTSVMAMHRFFEVALGIVVALAFTLCEVRITDMLRRRKLKAAANKAALQQPTPFTNKSR